MTYNIAYEEASGSAWWFVLWIAAGIAVAVFGIVIAQKKRKYFRRFGIFRGVLASLIGLAGIVTGATFATIAHDQLMHHRTEAVERAWGLNDTDADYLLQYRFVAPSGSCFIFCDGGDKPTTALVTIDGKPVQAYMLQQGHGLSLMVDDKPLPVRS